MVCLLRVYLIRNTQNLNKTIAKRTIKTKPKTFKTLVKDTKYF